MTNFRNKLKPGEKILVTFILTTLGTYYAVYMARVNKIVACNEKIFI